MMCVKKLTYKFGKQSKNGYQLKGITSLLTKFIKLCIVVKILKTKTGNNLNLYQKAIMSFDNRSYSLFEKKFVQAIRS